MKTNLNASHGQKADAQGHDKKWSTRMEEGNESGQIPEKDEANAITSRTPKSNHSSWDQLKDSPRSDSSEYDRFLNQNYGPEQDLEPKVQDNSDRGNLASTGYGSTPYNNRDVRRENSAKADENKPDQSRIDRGGYINKDPNV